MGLTRFRSQNIEDGDGVDLSADVFSTLPVPNGGTGVTTFTAGLLYSAGGTAALTTKAAPTGVIVGTTDSQTLSNKTLASPTITGTATLGAIKPAADSTSALTLYKADGTTALVTLDSTNGRLGIGVTGPSYALDVAGEYSGAGIGPSRVSYSGSNNYGVGMSLDATGAGGHTYSMLSEGSGAFTGAGFFSIFDNTAGARRVVIDPSGNVGIGTNGPNQKLEVAGIGRFTGSGAFSVGNDGSQNRIDTLGAAGLGNQIFRMLGANNSYAGLRTRQVSIGASYGDSDAPADGLIVQGNVGIGTNNPSTKLEVDTSTTGPALRVVGSASGTATDTAIDFAAHNGSPSPTYGRISLNISNGTPGAETGGLGFWTSYSGTLAEKMRLTYSGHLGVGATDPSSSLTVHTDTAPSANDGANNLRLEYDGGELANSLGPGITFAQRYYTSDPSIVRTGGIFGYKQVGSGAFGGGLVFYTQPNSAADMGERVRIDQNGNVGIGTTNPADKLTVNRGPVSDSTGGITINNDTTNGYGGALNITGNSIGTNYVLGRVAAENDGTGSYMSFSTAATGYGLNERMRIDKTGNVGIGDTDPTTPLDVNGIVTSRSAVADTPSAPTEGLRMSLSSYSLTNRYRNSIFNSVSASPTASLMQFRVNNGDSTQATVMSLLGNGNVGIGTDSPSYNLDVGSHARVQGHLGVGDTPATDRQLAVTSSGAKTASDYGLVLANLSTSSTSSVDRTALYLASSGAWSGTSANAYGLYIADVSGGTSNYAIYSPTSASSYLSGNVGIATTTPTNKLDVNGSAGALGLHSVQAAAPTGVTLTADAPGSTGPVTMSVSAVFTDGIEGPTATSNSVSWDFAASDAGTLVWTVVPGAVSYRVYADDGTLSTTTTGTSVDVAMSNGDGSTHPVDTSGRATFYGKVGVGTSTPAYLLDVNGTANATVLQAPTVQTNGTTTNAVLTTPGLVFNSGAEPVTATTYGVSGITQDAGASGATFTIESDGSGVLALNPTGSQVAVGTSSPVASALFQINSTTKGVLGPRMTTTQRTAISSPAEGLEVYDTTTHKKYCYDGTTWQPLW